MEERRRSLRGSTAPRIVSVRDAIRELKPRVPYTQKKEKKRAGRWRRRGTGARMEEGGREGRKGRMEKKDEKRSKRGKERREPYIARLLAEPEIDLGKNPPVASSLSHLPLHRFPRFLLLVARPTMVAAGRCWPPRRTPVFAFVLGKKDQVPRRGCEKLFLASPSHGTDRVKEGRKKETKKKKKTRWRRKKEKSDGKRETEGRRDNHDGYGDDAGRPLVYPAHQKLLLSSLIYHHIERFARRTL